MLFRSENSSEPKQGRAAPLHRDAPRHHRHHDVSAADGRRPRHAHVARQHSNALQAAGGSNCQCRLALPVTMAASELLCRAHSSSAQRSRPPVTSPRRLHPARGGRHHPWVTATAPVPAAAVAVRFLPAARPDPRRATPPTHKHGHTPRHRRPPSPLPPPPPSLSPPLPPTCFTADSKREAAKARRQNPENVAIV